MLKKFAFTWREYILPGIYMMFIVVAVGFIVYSKATSSQTARAADAPTEIGR